VAGSQGDVARQAWQELRALRAAPVGHAADDADRREVFTAALRQAQELAEAAEVSGPATRPLPLYYSFSQGLRAVAAARQEDDAWRIWGHGATVRPGETSILDTTIKPAPTKAKPGDPTPKRDALSSLHALAGHPPLANAVTLEAVWCADAMTPPLPASPGRLPRPLTLHLPPSSRPADDAASGFIELAVEGLDANASDADIATTMAHYPSLAGWRSPRSEASDPSRRMYYDFAAAQVRFARAPRNLDLAAFRRWILTAPVLRWDLSEPTVDEYQATFARLAEVDVASSSSQRIAYPSLDGQAPASLPAVTFLLLIALSSLVRYDPAGWAHAIDTDSSQLAVPIEVACDRALAWVPQLLGELLAG
jgi:hypothetical protein